MVGTRSKNKADHDAPASIASSRPKRAGASGKIVRGSKKKVLAASKNSTNKNKKKEDESSVTSVAVASAAATKSKAGSTDAIIKEALVKSQYSKTISPKAASTPEGRGRRVHKPSAKKKALNSIQRVKEKANVDISSPVNLNMKSPTADDHDYHKENDWVQCDDCKAWHQHPKEFRGKFSGEWSCWMMKWDPLDESKSRCVKSTTTNSGDIRRRRTLSAEKAKIQEEMSSPPPAPSTLIDTISQSTPKDSIKSPRLLKGQAGQISTTRPTLRKRLYTEQTEGKEKSLEEKEDVANSLIRLSLSNEHPQWQLPKNKSQSPSQGKIDASSSSSSPSKSKTDISPASSHISYPASSPPSFQESPSSNKENNRPRSPSNSLDKQKSTMSLQRSTNIKEGTVLTVCPSSSQLKNTESTSNHVEEAASAATKKKKEKDAATVATVKKTEEAAVAAVVKKSKEEEDEKRKEEAAAVKKSKEEEDAAAAAEKSKEEEDAAAKKRKEEAAASTKKRKEEAASAKERTKSPSSTNPGTRGWGIKLPQHMEGIPLHCYSDIDAGMESEYLNFLRHGKEITEAKFCFDDITIIDRDYLILSISTLCNDERLWAGYSILDLATLWTFLNQGGDMQWCALPARFFESLRTGSYGKKESGLVNRVLNMTHHSTDLFLFDVITFPVWFEDHFSVVFILYAGNVVKGLYGNMIDEKDPHPCIIYANSIPGMKSKFHNKDKVAESIRTFLNKFGQENIPNWRRCFNKNSFPVYELKGKIFFRFLMST